MYEQQNRERTILSVTESVCPECLKRLPASRVAYGDCVFLEKNCPDHGDFKVKIWQGRPDYQSWARPKVPSQPSACTTAVDLGCPFDCGLCPAHRQHSCCVLLEVTQRCNLHCPVCFAVAQDEQAVADVSMTEITAWYQKLLDSGGPYNIQLSGGEPTVRDDLPEIIALGRSMGFDFIQINTNGVRLAYDEEYVKQLKAAGLSCVFLQFDGTEDSIYEKLRGTALLKQKKAAIECCGRHQLGVVLVPTLVPGVNVDNVGRILQFAIEQMPVVRGVHFQPISYFGRYPQRPEDSERLTIPELLGEIEVQTQGQMKVEHFHPPGGENAYCSFNGSFILMPEGNLISWKQENEESCCCQPKSAAQGAVQARTFVAKQWSAPVVEKTNLAESALDNKKDSFDIFLERVNSYSLAVSGMAFQDAWNLDLERLKDCFIHVVSPDRRVIPFCAYNLTNRQGQALYRGR